MVEIMSVVAFMASVVGFLAATSFVESWILSHQKKA